MRCSLVTGVQTCALPISWKLDVHAKMKNRLMVTGLGLDSEWTADLQIGGAPDNPVIPVRADLIPGDYEFAGREFELYRWIIRFAGELTTNPAIHISATASANALKETIHVTGNQQKTEIPFTPRQD